MSENDAFCSAQLSALRVRCEKAKRAIGELGRAVDKAPAGGELGGGDDGAGKEYVPDRECVLELQRQGRLADQVTQKVTHTKKLSLTHGPICGPHGTLPLFL